MPSDVVSPTPPSCAEDQIACVEKEILCTEEEIQQRVVFLCGLRAKRNSFLPVFRLLPETLSAIFIYGARDYYESGHYTPFPSWINVSYVCSHWRNVALNCPILWAYHSNLSLRWTQESLLRSKQAPLKISYICPNYQWKDVSQLPRLLDSWLKHSGRIQELRLSVPSSYLPEKLSLCIPHIETLELSIKATSTQPIEIADGDKLRLRKLTLVNCSLPWYSLNLSGLKTLFLYFVGSPSPPNMVELLAILSGMQDLTVLRLEFVLPGARGFLSSGRLNSSPKIDLPGLSLFAVTAPLSTVIALLSCVNIPLSARVYLGLIFEPGSSIGEYSLISSFIAQQFKGSGSTFCSMSLCAIEVPGLMLGLDHKCPYLHKDVDCDIPLKILLRGDSVRRWPLRTSDLYRILSDMSLSLPLANIQTLYVYQKHECEFPPKIWKEILGCLDGLRTMKLTLGFMPDLSLLSIVSRESNENPGEQPIPGRGLVSRHKFVPALEELVLRCVMFKDEPSSGSRSSFLDAISTRKGLKLKFESGTSG